MSEGVRRWSAVALIAALLAVVVVGLATGQRGGVDRAYTLESRLRCPVCKQVSIAESPSETAASMRRIVADQIAAGRSDEQIITYFEDRYGVWVLLDPPPRGGTLLLWLLPVIAAVIGLAVTLTRARHAHAPTEELSAAERHRVAEAVREYRSRMDEEDEP
ncbi:cytochrome c-type biogenesis protein CcmH [Kribbella aluminosa]|uniref:Cytochrome c-type biogenesis protein n=1 Tax=Kribbella aluminosa TaxID=416017 RepID=A0ABS4UBJ7_9ACTN|nr:cytochrome c-type biogenesis protein [Kribbella aluminosa]MBP2348995.1 cytochrome c-type biogenesis protein CcmH [Kribbella aluminosa]